MARSRHTVPPRIRAASRVRAPYTPRGRGDSTTAWGSAAALKRHGLIAAAGAAPIICDRPTPLPRVRVRRPGHAVVIPMPSRRLNCLNVAAATAVAL